MQPLLLKVESVLSDRGKEYPAFADEARTITRIHRLLRSTWWTAAMGFCILMVIMKLVREAYHHKRDNIIDIIGYLVKYDELVTAHFNRWKRGKKAKNSSRRNRKTARKSR